MGHNALVAIIHVENPVIVLFLLFCLHVVSVGVVVVVGVFLGFFLILWEELVGFFLCYYYYYYYYYYYKYVFKMKHSLIGLIF